MTIYQVSQPIKVRDTKTGEYREAVKRTAVDHNGNIRVRAFIEVKPKPRFVEVPNA